MKRSAPLSKSPVDTLFDRRRKRALSHQETNLIIAAYQASSDIAEKRSYEDQIVSSHFPGAISLMRRRFAKSTPPEELTSIAYFAIRKAMEKYRSDKGASFMSYLGWWTLAYYNRQLNDEDFIIVREPRHVTDGRRTVRRHSKDYVLENGTMPSAKDLTAHLQTKISMSRFGKDKERMVKKLLLQPTMSTVSFDSSGNEGSGLYEVFNNDEETSIEHTAEIGLMHKKALELFERFYGFLSTNVGFQEADILIASYLYNQTLSLVGDRTGYTRERIRQILNIHLPKHFKQRGWPHPSLFNDIVLLTLLSHQCSHQPNHTLPKKLHGAVERRRVKGKKTFRILGVNGYNFDAALQACRHLPQTLQGDRPITCTIGLPYVGRLSVKDRVALGHASGKLPRRITNPSHLIQALYATLSRGDPADMTVFDGGRAVLVALSPAQEKQIHATIIAAEREGLIMILSNPLQGEALRVL